MYITVSMFMIVAITMVSLMAGFWVGRSLRWKLAETEEENGGQPGEQTDEERFVREAVSAGEGRETVKEEGSRTRFVFQERKNKMVEKVIPRGWAIGSPCAGEVSFFYEGSRRGAVIQAQKGMVYAPASGKITKLYPMGNAFLLCAEFGVELLIKVGSCRDEMFSMYYRPRIVQNEIVNKGKLLLEFDLEGLEAENVDASVSISVEAAQDSREILVTGQKYVRVGEEVLWVRDQKTLD